MEEYKFKKIQEELDIYLGKFHNKNFIEKDPISIPHTFKDKQDIEISAFLTSILSFGRRDLIIKKSFELMKIMDNSPYNFLVNHSLSDLKIFNTFIYRMVRGEDIIFILRRLQEMYLAFGSLEDIFYFFYDERDDNLEKTLIKFHNNFFENSSKDFRTRKHLPSPFKRSTCKRINMFLRWMVRKDRGGVDFGLWHNIPPSKLLCPCDIHVITQAKRLSIISQTSATWNRVLEITEFMRLLCKEDPIKYDIALFSVGVNS